MKIVKLFLMGMALSGLSTAGMAATVTGKVNLDGTPPSQEMVKMEADPICKMQHSTDVFTEKVVVNQNGTLKNVLVYVKEGLGSQTFPLPSESVVLDQKGCQYIPHVMGLRTGQTLKILNDDDTLHNVHGKTRTASLFNLAMPFKGLELEQKFDQADMIKFVCEVHPWMNAYAGVFNHPFFSVTGSEGTFEIKDLPAGTYVIEAWHEKYKILSQTITVAQEDTKQADFTFKAEE